MGLQTLLQRRKGGTYYFRQKVPPELRGIIGKTELVKSLRTKSPTEAKSKVKRVQIKYDNFLNDARRQLENSVAPEPDVSAMLQRAEAAWAEVLVNDAQQRASSHRSHPDYSPDCLYLDDVMDAIHAELTGERYEELAWPDEVQRWLTMVADRMGMPLSPVVRHAILRTSGAALVIMCERERGHWREDHGTPLSTPKSGPTITTIFERWKDERKPTPKSVWEYGRVVRRFTEVVGNDIPVTEIVPDHVRQFKEALLKLPARIPHKLKRKPMPEIIRRADPALDPLAPGAVKKFLGAFKTVLNYAKDNGYIDRNPADSVKYQPPRKVRAVDQRLSYSDDDVTAIWGATSNESGALYWIPRLALYTGARLNEIGQSNVDDIGYDGEAKCHYLHIHDEGESRSLKTHTSLRKVPIHPDLIEIGFLDYVDERRRAGGSLWPDLGKPDIHGNPTGYLSKRYAKVAREEAGITDRRKVFHSFRHTFKDACRAAAVPEDVHDALTGHTSTSVSRTYGSGEYPMNVLWDAIQRLQFPTTHL